MLANEFLILHNDPVNKAQKTGSGDYLQKLALLYMPIFPNT